MTKMAQHGDYTVRRMTRDELDLASSWAVAEEWNPGRFDAACFHAVDPDGFFVGILDGEAVASLSAVAYDASYGFLGLYIVKPELRGLGYGIELWNAAMAYLGDRNVGLDAVIAQVSNYEKSGFKTAYRDVRYKGIGEGAVAPGLTNLTEIPFAEIAAYDSAVFGTPRHRFLACWLRQPGYRGVGMIDDRQLHGYGVIRPAQTGFRIGPLFADEEAIAETIFQALAADVGDVPIFIDVPEVNRAVRALVQRHKMEPMFECVRMYNKKIPETPIAKIYGVTSFELVDQGDVRPPPLSHGTNELVNYVRSINQYIMQSPPENQEGPTSKYSI
jgi:ribosomal protein S18 acetylase RimI-like enzyme